MKRRLIVVAVLLVATVAAYELLIRDGTVEPTLREPRAVAVIGSGATAVGVSAEGSVLDWLPAPRDGTLPRLPLSRLPAKRQLSGPVLQQVRVLGAAPRELLAHVESTSYGESGVDVVLRSGIELRFGDSSQAARKWKAAAAVLASPTTTSLDYVNLYSPGRPDVGGSGHSLPPAP